MLRRARSRLRGDGGSATVYTVVFAVAVISLLGLIVDGGIAMNARERAADIAGQAARAAADDINVATLRDSGSAVINTDACDNPGGPAASLVQSYDTDAVAHSVDRVLAASLTGCVAGPHSVTVTVRVTTQALVPGVFSGFTESAQATAVPECGINQGVVC